LHYPIKGAVNRQHLLLGSNKPSALQPHRAVTPDASEHVRSPSFHFDFNPLSGKSKQKTQLFGMAQCGSAAFFTQAQTVLFEHLLYIHVEKCYHNGKYYITRRGTYAL